MPIFPLCIFCTRTIFASSSFRFSSLYSVRNSIISVADDFERRFLFFFGGSRQLARGNSSSSSVDVLPVAGFAVKEETVAVGIIFGSVPKNSSSSCWKSHSFRSLPVLSLCSLTFLYFSSSFFHLLEHCSPVTLTDEVKLNFSAIFCQATFLRTLPLEKRLSFSSRSEINNFVLFVDQVINFVSSPSSSVIKIYIYKLKSLMFYVPPVWLKKAIIISSSIKTRWTNN